MAIGAQDDQRSRNWQLLTIAFSVLVVLLSVYLAIIGGIRWNQSPEARCQNSDKDANTTTQCYNKDIGSTCFTTFIAKDPMPFNEASVLCNSTVPGSSLIRINSLEDQRTVEIFLGSQQFANETIVIDAQKLSEHDSVEWSWLNGYPIVPEFFSSETSRSLNGGAIATYSGQSTTPYGIINQRYEWRYICEYSEAKPAFSYRHNNSYYFVSTESATWYEARNECLRLGGDLASITDPNMIRNWSLLEDYVTYSIGLHRNKWIWKSTGSALTYTNWEGGYPEEASNNQCICINPQCRRKNHETICDNDRKWRTCQCGNNYAVVCQKGPIPPSIIRSPPRELIYRDGDTVSLDLDCQTMGASDVKYEWTKNGLGIDQTLPNIRKGMDCCTITIEAATAMDEGLYQCFARNQYGTALSITTQVQRAFLDSSSGTPSVVSKYLFPNSPFYIACDRRKSFPKPTYIWEIYSGTEDSNPIKIVPTEQIQIDENGNLHFGVGVPNDYRGFDGKFYRCSTYNTYLDLKEGGDYSKLQIDLDCEPAQRSREARGFFSDSHPVAVIGRSMTLRCFFYRNLEPITWSGTGPGRTLPTGRYKLDAFNTSLTIYNITASDEGPYGCQGSNAEEHFGAIFRVRVEAEPMFPTATDAPYVVNVTEGDSFTFNCSVSAKPEAKIVWFQNGKELDPGHLPETFELSNDNRCLTIRDVCRDCVDQERQTEDLMVIQCNASNIHGYAFAQRYVNVPRKYKKVLDPAATGTETWIILLIVLLLILVLFILICLQKKKREKSEENTAIQVSEPQTEASGPHYEEIPVNFESAQDKANQVTAPGTELHNAEIADDFESATATQQSRNDYVGLAESDRQVTPSRYEKLL